MIDKFIITSVYFTSIIDGKDTTTIFLIEIFLINDLRSNILVSINILYLLDNILDLS